MRDYNVFGKAGENKPLPDLIETADQLSGLVKFFVERGFDKWPLPPRILAKWRAPILMDNTWIVGGPALKRNWQLFLMGMVREQFSKYVKTIEMTKTSKSQGVHGVLVVTRAIPMDDILRFLEDRGFIKKAGRA